MRRFALDRRTFLRGLGVTLALPLFEAMLNSHGTALAAGTPLPKRFATFFFGNGVRLDRWVPKTTGTDWALSPALAPLVNVKPYLNVVSGYKVKVPDLRGHHCGSAGILSGYPFIPLNPGGSNYSSKFGGPSIDQMAADSIGAKSTFKSIQLAVSKRATTSEGPTLQVISHRGPDAPLSPLTSPLEAFNKFFAMFTPVNPNDPVNRLRSRLLDAVRSDAKRLELQLGASDRHRLDAHLTAVDELQKSINTLPPVITSTCQKPAAINESNQDSGGKERLGAVSKAMSDILALAWACDLTRVASVQFSGSVGGTVYSDIGQTDNEHNITHDPGQQDRVHDAVVFVMKNFAYLLEKLKASPEGAGGNLLDSSVLLCSSDVSEGLVHSTSNYPILVAGKAGGLLRYPGVHVRSAAGDNASDVLLSCLQASGTGLTSVGKDGGLSSAPCKAIMA